MQAKYIIIAILVIAAAAVVAGPATAAASQYPMTISDNFNRTATLAKAPERIVSLSPSNTELLFELGVGSKIVGTDDYSNYPAEANNITHVSGFAEVSYEKITAVNPDVIFCDDIIGEPAVTKLRSMGFQVIELKNSNLTMLRKNIDIMGMVTNTSGNATTLIAGIDGQVNQIAAKAAALNLSSKPNVLLLTGLYSDETIYPFGNGTYGDELITMAGGRNAAGAISQYGVMSHEAIVLQDPDVIIIPVDAISAPSVRAFQNGSMQWANGLTAVKKGQVYTVDADIVNRPAKIADSGLLIADIIQKYAANQTKAPTQAPATTPTSTPAPGFEAVFALAGLLGIACLFAGKKQ
ncbi:MAG TPA: ABC transporter substrate-binding protein [Methanocella sp.]|jgi:iron complex transport system substrate-binding protein